jgi:type II secretory pathway predicted ATPase ExeA
MYRKHFALTRFPFEAELAPEELFAGTAMAEAEARLKHLLELRAIGLFTGEAGSGKTTICRKVASALHPSLYRLFYVPLSTGSVMDMYHCLAWELGLPGAQNRAGAFRQIRSEVTRLTREAKQRAVVVIDEAHHLRNEVLEDLRLLTNYEMDSHNRLCLILVGLTELRRRLAMAVHESLAQRIVVRYHFSGLTRNELPEYLIHRLRLAGCELALFEPSAVEALFQATQGMPRKVNLLAHYALSAAALANARTVSSEHLQAALEDLGP